MNTKRSILLSAAVPWLLLTGCGGGSESSGGGNATPTPTPSAIATPTPTASATPAPTATPGPTASPTPAPTSGAAALGGVDAKAVPEIYGIYIAGDSQVTIDQSANFIGALFGQSASGPLYVVGKLTGSSYDPVSRFVFFQATGDAFDAETSTGLTFSISDGRMDDGDDELGPMVVSLSDGRSVTISRLLKKSFNGTTNGDLTGEFRLAHTPQDGLLAFRIDGPSGTISTPLTLQTDCEFSGQIVRNGPSWTTEVFASGEACPYVGRYLGLVGASLQNNPICRNLLFRQIALFDEQKTRFIMGCLKD